MLRKLVRFAGSLTADTNCERVKRQVLAAAYSILGAQFVVLYTVDGGVLRANKSSGSNKQRFPAVSASSPLASTTPKVPAPAVPSVEDIGESQLLLALAQDAQQKNATMMINDLGYNRMMLRQQVGHQSQSGYEMVQNKATSKQARQRVRNVLSTVIRDSKGNVSGVLQSVNKVDIVKEATQVRNKNSVRQQHFANQAALATRPLVDFASDDAEMIEAVATVAGRAMENSRIFSTQDRMSAQTKWMLNMLQVFSAELDVDMAVDRIIECSYNILNCDRCSLYLVDEEHQELVCRVSQDVQGIRIPLNAGIAGHVVTTGELLNVPDVDEDERFDRTVDTETGYKTVCILCAPVRNLQGKVVAVMQAINKRAGKTATGMFRSRSSTTTSTTGTARRRGASSADAAGAESSDSAAFFTADDEVLVMAISNQAGIALNNASLYDVQLDARRKSDILVETSRMMSSELRLKPLVKLMTGEARRLIEADRCAVFLLDHATNELWSVLAEGVSKEIRFPANIGVAGHVAATGESLRIDDAYSNRYFNKDTDILTGYRTETMLAVPIKDSKGDVIGVVQMINKLTKSSALDNKFNKSDQGFLEVFASVAAVAINNAHLYEKINQFGDYVGAVLQSLSSYVFTLNAKGQLVLCNREIRDVLNEDEHVMRTTSFEDWMAGERGHNPQLAQDISAVFQSGEAVLVTDYALKIRMNEEEMVVTRRSQGRSVKEGASGSREEEESAHKTMMVNYTILPLTLDSNEPSCGSTVGDDFLMLEHFENRFDPGTKANAGGVSRENVAGARSRASGKAVKGTRKPRRSSLRTSLQKQFSLTMNLAKNHHHAKPMRDGRTADGQSAEVTFGDIDSSRHGGLRGKVNDKPGADADGERSSDNNDDDDDDDGGKGDDHGANGSCDEDSGDADYFGQGDLRHDATTTTTTATATTAISGKVTHDPHGSPQGLEKGSEALGLSSEDAHALTKAAVSSSGQNAQRDAETQESKTNDDIGGQDGAKEEAQTGELEDQVSPNLRDALKRSTTFSSSWKSKSVVDKVYGIVVILEPIDERDRMQYKLMRYKNRLSFVQSELDMLKKRMTIARTTPIQQIRSKVSELCEMALVLDKRDATADGATATAPLASGGVDEEDKVEGDDDTVAKLSTSMPDSRLKLELGAAPGGSSCAGASNGPKKYRVGDLSYLLHEVKTLLASQDLFRPAFMDSEMDGDGQPLDPVMVKRHASGRSLGTSSSSPAADGGPSKGGRASDYDENMRFLRMAFGAQDFPNVDKRKDSFPFSLPSDRRPSSTRLHHAIRDIDSDELYALRSWDLDLLRYEADELVPLVLDQFADLKLIDHFRISLEKLSHWVSAVRTNYHNNPFHNFHHAVNVAHVSYLILVEPGMTANRLHMLDVLSLMVASLCHDMDHPGHNNMFEVNSGSKLAIMYNDRSVLENRHASLTFQVLQRPENAIIDHLPAKDQRYMRKLVVTSILHTDMALHFELMSKFDAWISQDFEYKNIDSACREDQDVRMLVVNTVLHCADLSNPVRKFETSKRWALLLNEEFSNQVAAEMKAGLPVSEMMMNGDDMAVVAQREVNFLDFVVIPCWSTFEAFLPTVKARVVQAYSNKRRWLDEKKRALEGNAAERTSDVA